MQKNAAAASARPLPTGVYINRAGRPVVTLPKDTQLAVPLAANQVTKTDCKEDATTYKGKRFPKNSVMYAHVIAQTYVI